MACEKGTLTSFGSCRFEDEDVWGTLDRQVAVRDRLGLEEDISML